MNQSHMQFSCYFSQTKYLYSYRHACKADQGPSSFSQTLYVFYYTWKITTPKELGIHVLNIIAHASLNCIYSVHVTCSNPMQLHSLYYLTELFSSKFSWGSMPPDPPRKGMLRACRPAMSSFPPKLFSRWNPAWLSIYTTHAVWWSQKGQGIMLSLVASWNRKSMLWNCVTVNYGSFLKQEEYVMKLCNC